MLSTIILLVALGCFVLAAVGYSVPRVDLTAAGLACLVISMIVRF